MDHRAVSRAANTKTATADGLGHPDAPTRHGGPLIALADPGSWEACRDTPRQAGLSFNRVPLCTDLLCHPTRTFQPRCTRLSLRAEASSRPVRPRPASQCWVWQGRSRPCEGSDGPISRHDAVVLEADNSTSACAPNPSDTITTVPGGADCAFGDSSAN